MTDNVTRMEFDLTVDQLRSDIKEIKDLVEDLHRTLVVDNGGMSVVGRLTITEEKVDDLAKDLKQIKEGQLTKYKTFYSKFWDMAVKVAIAILMLLVAGSSLTNESIVSLVKALLK